MEQLGTLERVDVRKAWGNEPRDFTPWLSQNLQRLSASLGIENLDLEGTEVQVGPYKADIIARIPQDGTQVLIENQLENADLQHLGQILAYLAGLEARIIVWIATGFHEAHLSVIRWLNEHTTDPFAFFAVRVGIVRIGNSQLAPVFDVLERPNEWDRQVRGVARTGELSETGKFCREFWQYYADRYPDDGVRQGHASTNVYHRVEEANLQISQYLARASGGVGVYIAHWMSGEPKESVRVRAESYNAALNMVGLDQGTFLKTDCNDRENWSRIADWLHEKLCAYRRVLREDVSEQSA